MSESALREYREARKALTFPLGSVEHADVIVRKVERLDRAVEALVALGHEHGQAHMDCLAPIDFDEAQGRAAQVMGREPGSKGDG